MGGVGWSRQLCSEFEHQLAVLRLRPPWLLRPSSPFQLLRPSASCFPPRARRCALVRSHSILLTISSPRPSSRPTPLSLSPFSSFLISLPLASFHPSFSFSHLPLSFLSSQRYSSISPQKAPSFPSLSPNPPLSFFNSPSLAPAPCWGYQCPLELSFFPPTLSPSLPKPQPASSSFSSSPWLLHPLQSATSLLLLQFSAFSLLILQLLSMRK